MRQAGAPMHDRTLHIFIVACALWISNAACAQQYPIKPLRLIVPFAAGGGTDIIARHLAQKLGDLLRQQVVVDNRGGAGGNIGMELTASAQGDGYTLVLGHTGTLSFNPTLYEDLKYDVLRDFQPISLVANLPAMMAINPSVPAKTLRQFIAFAKARPGSLTYGSGGQGGANHLATEYFKLLTKTDITHVPYRSAGLAAVDAISGQIAMVMPAIPVVLPHVRSGKLRGLGVSSASRMAIAPDVPTIAESGVPEYVVNQWYGVLAPAKTPHAIIVQLQTAIAQAVASADLKERMTAEGMEAAASTPAAFVSLIKSETTRWATVIKAAGLK